MNRQRLRIGLQLAAGLVLAGLGHYYSAVMREAYPYDGVLYYAAAAVCFVLAWRSLRREPDPVWVVLRDSLRTTWGVLLDALRVIGSTLRDLLPMMPARTLALIVIGLNVFAAIIAVLIPSAVWLWLIVWMVSAAIAIGYALRRSRWWPRVAARSKLPPKLTARTWVEPVEAIGQRPSLIGLAMALGLIVVGQVAIGTTSRSGLPAPSIAAAIDDALKLNLLDPAMILGGWLMLIAGTLVFAVVTRRLVLSGHPRLTIDAPSQVTQRLAIYWLIPAVIAFMLWLSAIRSIIGGAAGWGGVLPWLIAMVLMAACWWQIDRARGVRLSVRLSRSETIALGIAFVVILIVFAYRLGDVPIGIWGDEGAFFVTARDIARNTVTPDAFGLGTYSFPMAGSIYQAFWIELFGENVAAWRLGSIIVAALVSVPLYFLVRTTLGRRVAWTSIALYAVSPYLLTYARMGYNNIQAILPVVLMLALTWIAARRDSRLYAFLAGGAGGLTFFTHPSARIVILLALGWLLWMWITRTVRGRSIVGQIAVMSLGLIVIAAPPIVYGVSRYPDAFANKLAESSFNNVFYARDLFPETDLYSQTGSFHVGDQQLFYEPSIYASLLVRGAVRTALSFHTPTIVNENFLIGALADPFGIVYVLGLGWCLARWKRSAYAIFPAWLLIGGFVLSGMSAFPPRAALMLPVAPALIVLSAVGLVAAIDLLAAIVGGVPDRVKLFGVIGLTVVLGYVGLRTYFVDMPARFPPDLDNTIFWYAQQMKPGADVTLIQPVGTPDDYQPWGMREFDLGVNFHLIKPDALPATNWANLCSNGCAFFFPAADYERVLPQLTQAFGAIAPTPYTDAGGTIQFYAFAP
jgi:4-amino-4-deoxy-L-arabinose transferase-like glycosyltransferase